MGTTSPNPASQTALNRTLSLPLVTFYGLGTILGAGIYVLIGEVAAAAGTAAPAAFLIASIVAGFTAFSYAELTSRIPESAGEAAFADAAFHKRPLTALAGWGVVFTGIVSTATVTGAVLLFATTLHTVALATITSTITLVVFCVVNASLLRLKLSAATTPANATTYPRWVPAVGLTLSVTLLVLQFVLG